MTDYDVVITIQARVYAGSEADARQYVKDYAGLNNLGDSFEILDTTVIPVGYSDG